MDVTRYLKNFSSPFRYPGGKSRLALKLSEIIDKSFNSDKKIILVEPYAGGAGASLYLLFNGTVDKIIINDLDNAIHTFWKIAVKDADYFIRRIKRTKITIEEWKKQKKIYILLKNKKNLTLKQKRNLAFATLFLNRTNRSGIINGGPIGGMKQSGKWKINERFTKKTLINRFKQIKSFSNKISVYNLDGIKLLKKIEKKQNINQHFIFLDPPYFQKGRSLYLNNYKDDNHKELSDFLIKSSLKKWIMTYNDVSYIKKIYKEMKIKKFTIHHNAHYSKVGKEIMIFPKKFMPADI